MAKGFKAGVGGGVALNFKVVGNPQPEAPRENTIWVNTDVPIGVWYFSATQPENMAEGEVWFRTGTSSSTAFNALKKQNIMVYPLQAQQYINGALVDVTAKIYQDGAWQSVLVPAEYQAVEYIEGTGTQYINCDVAPKINFSFDAVMAFTQDTAALAGLYKSSGGYGYRVEFIGRDNKFGLFVNNAEASVSTKFIDETVVAGTMTHVHYEQGSKYQKMTVNEKSVEYATTASAVDTFTLLRYRGGSTTVDHGRIGNVVVYNDGELVRDMVPCYRRADSVAGMYDRIDGRFFVNAGSGTFVVGADV